MNEKLKELYIDRFELLTPELEEYNSTVDSEKKATNPFLIRVPSNYERYQNKIMIFGQETNSWGKECGNNAVFSNNIEKSLDIYEKFYLNGGINSYRGPFWSEFKRIKKEIEKLGNSVFVWNNINKIGITGKGNLGAINEIQFNRFQVVNDEIELLKPNIIVFLTGPNYDFFIEKNIGSFKQTKISDSLYSLEFKSKYSNIKFFKTYHPNGLYHLKKNKIVIPNLIKEIKQICR